MPDPRPKRSGPPRNSGVRELVSNRRRYHTPQTREMGKAGFRGWHERGFLPHYDVPNVTQFVTLGLTDALPPNALAGVLAKADERERRNALERELDLGHGACWLRQPEVASIVEGALLHFQGERYQLRAFVVMGNRVHVVLHVSTVPLSKIIGDWKSLTAHEANGVLKRNGQFWAEDYFDTLVRDGNHEKRVIRYVEHNPCKSKLVVDPKEWPWSSARSRDEFGRLNLPNAERTAPGPGAAAPTKPNV